MYNSVSTSNQLPLTDTLMHNTGYGQHHSPITTQFQNPSGLPVTMSNLINSGPGVSSNQGFGGDIFDASDLSQYNFDPASFNFGNHYGALEFGILGHMATGASKTPPNDHQTSLSMVDGMMSNAGTTSSAYIGSPIATGYLFGQDAITSDWRTPTQPQSNKRSRPMTAFNPNGLQHDYPNAFSIGTNSSFTSPTSEMSPVASRSTDDTTVKMLFGQNSAPNSRPSTRHDKRPTNPSQQIHQNTVSSASVTTSRRRGDPSSVYRTITQPYSYTTGFHSLTAFLQKRFSSQQTLCIAKSLASIRPSFLACTKSLGREDLIFMEKCFQRTLWEYEDFINAIGTPTIVCRRTGEVAAVGKEFSILTGWKKDVLLGREANLNTNRGTSSSIPNTNTNPSSTSASTPNRGITTPKLPEGVLELSNHQQPVFLAELLDDESVIDFYKDFARLAFGDSHGTITTRCKLLKYRTAESGLAPPLPLAPPPPPSSQVAATSNPATTATATTAATGPTAPPNTTSDNSLKKSNSKRKRPPYIGNSGSASGIGGNTGSGGNSNTNTNTSTFRREDLTPRIDELADKDGKVDCSCCWTVKRDLFDLPMMIVMNVSL